MHPNFTDTLLAPRDFSYAQAHSYLDRMAALGWHWKVEFEVLFDKPRHNCCFYKDGVLISDKGDSTLDAIYNALLKVATTLKTV